MIRIQIKENEPLEKTLRRLRKLCNNEGVTKGIKRSSYYEKPSERRRRRQRERLKSIRMAALKRTKVKTKSKKRRR